MNKINFVIPLNHVANIRTFPETCKFWGNILKFPWKIMSFLGLVRKKSLW